MVSALLLLLCAAAEAMVHNAMSPLHSERIPLRSAMASVDVPGLLWRCAELGSGSTDALPRRSPPEASPPRDIATATPRTGVGDSGGVLVKRQGSAGVARSTGCVPCVSKGRLLLLLMRTLSVCVFCSVSPTRTPSKTATPQSLMESHQHSSPASLSGGTLITSLQLQTNAAARPPRNTTSAQQMSPQPKAVYSQLKGSIPSPAARAQGAGHASPRTITTPIITCSKQPYSKHYAEVIALRNAKRREVNVLKPYWDVEVRVTVRS